MVNEQPDRSLLAALAGLCLLGAAGCVTYPISKPLREQAKTTQAAGFYAIVQNPEAYRGQVVIWGGKILKTANETNGGVIYMLQSPLDSDERPLSARLSQGRFLVRSSGFLDPEVYRPGSKVTIAGDLVGRETQTVDKTTYAYPVVSVRQVFFWRPETAVYSEPPPWGWDWYWPYGPYYYGYYGGYYYPRYYYHPHFEGGFHGHR